MRLLVTGSAGLVGSYFIRLASDYEIYAAYNNNKPFNGIPIKLDLADADSIKEVINTIKPDAIIHFAAFTDVDKCEENKEYAKIINTDSLKTIAKYAKDIGSYLLHISTDYVFDGSKGNYKEDDKPNPINYYGLTKLEGEYNVKAYAKDWCIARISNPYGFHERKKTFPLFLIEQLKNNRMVRVVEDQVTSASYVKNICYMLLELLKDKYKGIIHVADDIRISRLDLAYTIADILNLDKSLIKRIKMDGMQWMAKRPRDSSLSIEHAYNILSYKPKRLEESLNMFMNELKSI